MKDSNQRLADYQAQDCLVIAAAVLAGLTVVGFTWLSEHALNLFFALRSALWWSPIV